MIGFAQKLVDSSTFLNKDPVSEFRNVFFFSREKSIRTKHFTHVIIETIMEISRKFNRCKSVDIRESEQNNRLSVGVFRGTCKTASYLPFVKATTYYVNILTLSINKKITEINNNALKIAHFLLSSYYGFWK